MLLPSPVHSAPRGSRGTSRVHATLAAVMSTIETFADHALVTAAKRPSGEVAMPHASAGNTTRADSTQSGPEVS